MVMSAFVAVSSDAGNRLSSRSVPRQSKVPQTFHASEGKAAREDKDRATR